MLLFFQSCLSTENDFQIDAFTWSTHDRDVFSLKPMGLTTFLNLTLVLFSITAETSSMLYKQSDKAIACILDALILS